MEAKNEAGIKHTAQLAVALKDRGDENVELQTQLDGAKIAAEVVDNAIKYRDDAIVKLTARLVEIQASNGTLNMASSSLQERYQDSVNLVARLENDTTQRSAAYRKLEKQAETSRKNFNLISKQLKSDRNVNIAELRKNLADQTKFLTAKIQSLETAQAELIDRLGQKSARIDELHSEIKRLLNIIVKAEAKLKKNKTFADCYGAGPIDLDIQEGLLYGLDHQTVKQLKSGNREINKMKRTIDVQEQTIEAMYSKLAKAKVEIAGEKSYLGEKCRMLDVMNASQRATMAKNIVEIAKLQTANTELKYPISDDFTYQHLNEIIDNINKKLKAEKGISRKLLQKDMSELRECLIIWAESFARNPGF